MIEQEMAHDMLSVFINGLINKVPFDAADDLRKTIPKEIGAYTWSTKRNSKLMYVGIATGRNGLYGRIIKQHLNPSYLLTDQDKWREKDEFQIAHYSFLNGKPAIDKSAFRKNLGREHNLQPGEETVNYIKSNFCLRFIVVPSRESARAIEKEIIQLYEPGYNIAGKR
jgi:hypothetical protein